MFSTVKKIHFVGIGGIGMSGIAEILISQGFEVSGSDLTRSINTEHLEKLGAKIYYSHIPQNIDGVEVVVYSSAVKPDENPETAEAKNRNIPLIRRAEMLAEVSRLNYCLAIAGTHGKTTTTSMASLVLIEGGLDPTALVGGRLRDFGGTNARLGKGKWTIVEADEYDRSFLQLAPTIAIINNIEPEHLDIYKDFDDIKTTFLEFANKAPFYGFVALGLDDQGSKEILADINKKTVTFGLSRHCDVRADKISYNERSSEFDVYLYDELKGRVTINIPGEHNIKNALGAITSGLFLDIEFEKIKAALAKFTGVYRRFEFKGEFNGAVVVDDYGHHPTEVNATLLAARKGWNRRVVGIFQPHTYTRTKHLAKEFGASFDEADVIIITDVYAAREKPIEGVTGELIANAARKFGHKNVYYTPTLAEAESTIREIAEENDIILTIGAGDVWRISESLAATK